MVRCFGDGDDLYADYHDTEWAVAPEEADEAWIFERLSLEVFQVGLSWLLILRRRPAFRELFAGFDPELVAELTPDDVERLTTDERIIRNRRKIEATVANARALLAMHTGGETLAALVAHHRPARVITRRPALGAVPAHTEESTALAKGLKARGFTFVGPTNVYAMMQALGVVDDHLATCPIGAARPAKDSERMTDIWDEVRRRTPLPE